MIPLSPVGPLDVAATTSFLDPAAPLAEVARGYLAHLLGGRRRPAAALVVDALRDGAALVDVYLHVFQRTQQEIGRLWHLGEVSIAQEHFCTAATQVVMAQMQSGVFASPRNGSTMVAACIVGNMHEVGLRIISDLYELDGWDTTYLGANTPAAAVKEMLAELRPDVVAVSAALPSHVRPIRDLIAMIRADLRCEATRIIVGGRAFNEDERIWLQIGADGHARDAREALDLGNRLVRDRAARAS